MEERNQKRDFSSTDLHLQQGLKYEVGKNAIVEEQSVPMANMIRLMRRVIPARSKIAEDAKEVMQECVVEFIRIVTSEANNRCQMDRRLAITAEDLLSAMSSFGFDDYIEPLVNYMNRYRETVDGGSLRGEPLVFMRSFDRGALVIVETMAMGGFVKDTHNAAGSSSGAASSPSGKCK